MRKNRKSSGQVSLLAVGLGNPGSRYSETRHNVGFRALETLGVRLRKPWCNEFEYGVYDTGALRIGLLRPLTYMNRSGRAVARAVMLSGVEPSSVVVVCDNLDLEAGLVRVKRGGSSAGHNGLKSIIEILGSEEFVRVYIGIGRPAPGQSVVDHVLGIPEHDEAERTQRACARAAQAIIRLAEADLSQVMNEFNTRSPVGN